MKRQTIPAIGVRGDITKSVCKNSGIPNCVSMGCPSLTISRDMNLGNTLHSNWSRVTQILSLLQQRRQTLHKISKKLKIAVTFPKSIKSISGYIGAALIATLIEQSHYDIDNTTTIVIVTQHKMDHKRMEQFIRTRLEQFNPKSRLLLDKNDTIHNVIKYIEYVNVESWLADASVQYDLCISFRIHGSMTFISSGVPTIAIPTDFRIMELVQAMKLPYIVPELLSQLLNSYITNVNNNDSNGMNTLLLSSLMENAKNTNFTMFEMNRRQKIQGWKDILEDAGLEMDPALFRIIKSP